MVSILIFQQFLLKKFFRNEEGVWQIPRMPNEDYYRTQMMRGIAQALNISTPMMDTLIQRYEAQLTAFQKHILMIVYPRNFKYSRSRKISTVSLNY